MNIIHVYHVRDPYDHSLGYSHNNTYNNVEPAVVKEVIAKQERYIKGNDIGGYWIQEITVEIGQPPVIVDHMKTLPQKTRIELNVKAKREGSKRKSVQEAFNAINALQGGNAVLNNVWYNEADHAHIIAPAVEQQQPVGEWI